MRRDKIQIAEGIELPNQERITALGEKENYKYLGILETDSIKRAKMKIKIRIDSGERETSWNLALQMHSHQKEISYEKT